MSAETVSRDGRGGSAAGHRCPPVAKIRRAFRTLEGRENLVGAKKRIEAPRDGGILALEEGTW